MSLFQLILVAVIQGITEFLPISSSGHLILLPGLTGMEDQGQVIDVAVHVGTLFAVVLYFWADVKVALIGTGRMLTGRLDTPGARLALQLVVATIPVIVAGFILHETGLSDAMRSVKTIAWTTLVFGVVLYVADQWGATDKGAGDWTVGRALIVGLLQAVALIPGTSRSGITMTGGRMLGFNRHEAARFAMLMSIPTIMASGLLLGMDVVKDADVSMAKDAAIAAVFAFISALLALWGMMKMLEKISFTPYVIYRLVLGAFLLVYVYVFHAA
ncbi:undecaprenyl-diphosphate phosphatase [Chachezhania sediminis]|uniref:undecaprenyl-diphosphate phosphatase n=1 Tax=Chachezhania sediminis TaxID=2599291 RepID=UPI00131B98B2|nr:undecaprenyl-diphosphate phosphatase [Chachezhania sediminis]